MKNILITLVLVVLAVTLAQAAVPSLKAVMKESGAMQHLDTIGKFASYANRFTKKHGVSDGLTLECALCGIVINEIEGFMIENNTVEFIEDKIKSGICSYFSGFSGLCDALVDDIPNAIDLVEKKYTVSVVCIELNYCTKPFGTHPDPAGVPTYPINLDLPPSQRWQQICQIPAFQQTAQFMTNTVNAILPDGGASLEYLGLLLNELYYPTEYAQEIAGCAKALGISVGWNTLFNLGYEVSDACTSIVAQAADGTIMHARNMDFWAGMGFTDSLKAITFIADWQKSGQTLFKTTSFAGYVGALSGMRPNGFSVTINSRFYPQGLGQLFYEIIAAIEERNATLVSFLTRDVLAREADFNSAVYQLSNDELIADVYYTVAGTKPGQGVVISRNRLNATNLWPLAPASNEWFVLQTNYDHWKKAPWFDDRVTPGFNAMYAMGKNNVTLQGLLNVLTVKPVFNIQTTYSILAIPSKGTYQSYTRWCPYPCVE
eukprot:TRINITY_DN727_c0_g1_i1.p1 TRINITY_DN727_c0_g1~~TRINITY_DN727_c0_g1_i1.p1  ORF type:complete len:488 (-),score=81.30 TRINITY_DN727_c0_g1_i1:33-1496(-)